MRVQIPGMWTYAPLIKPCCGGLPHAKWKKTDTDFSRAHHPQAKRGRLAADVSSRPNFLTKKRKKGAGPVAEWSSLHTLLPTAQGFASLDPRRGHGTARWAMLRQHPMCHNWKDLQVKIHDCVLWGFGDKKVEEKKRKKKRKCR